MTKNGKKLRNNAQPGLRARLAFSTALATLALGGYGGRGAYAGVCNLNGAGTYLCSLGANVATDVTQILFSIPLNVSTADGFGIDTSTTGGDALFLDGYGGLTFTDNHASSITGDDHGIYARNAGTGALSVTSSGSVVGTTRDGIYAFNSGTDLTIAA
jgi:hypothetical protein